MRLLFCVVILAAAAGVSWANIRAVNVRDIPGYDDENVSLAYLYDNLGLYYRWSAEWKSDVPKKDVVRTLSGMYDRFSRKAVRNEQNAELQLLLGDISHFLYNLDENRYFSIAMDHYAAAGRIEPRDYRPAWFSAHHLLSSAKPKEGMAQYAGILAKADPTKLPPDFWYEYTEGSMMSFMPSHARMGMDYFKKVTGNTSPYEKRFGEMIGRNMKIPAADEKIKAADQWMKAPDAEIYLNRPFGLRVDLGKGWDLRYLDGGKTVSSVSMLKAPAAKGKTGPVTYSFALTASVAKEGQTFGKFAEETLSLFRGMQMSEAKVTVPYEGARAVEILNPALYKNEGGARIVVILFERDAPEYPGVKIEMPVVPRSNGSVGYYTQKGFYSRYKEKIYYMIAMDTCESVYPASKQNLEKILSGILTVE